MLRISKSLSAVFLISLAGILLSFFQSAHDAEENMGLGLLFNLRGARQPPDDVVVVSVDKESADRLKPAGGLETLEEVQRLLRRLPTREREVVRLFYLEGRSYEEISTALHLPVNSIGPVLSRVKKKLSNGRARANSEPKDAATDGKQTQ